MARGLGVKLVLSATNKRTQNRPYHGETVKHIFHWFFNFGNNWTGKQCDLSFYTQLYHIVEIATNKLKSTKPIRKLKKLSILPENLTRQILKVSEDDQQPWCHYNILNT